MNYKGPCQACGHVHPTMASASRRGEQRWFCHADDHSCYNDMRGKYFEGEATRLWVARSSAHLDDTGHLIVAATKDDATDQALKMLRARGKAGAAVVDEIKASGLKEVPPDAEG